MTHTSPDPAEPPPRTRFRAAVGSAYRTVKERYQRSPRLQRLIWQHRLAPAFWTTASLLSLAINIFLIAALLIIGRQLFTLKTAIDEQLLTGLQQVVTPYRMLLSNTPDSAAEIDACQSWWGGWICRLLLGTP